jgi:hypothetical protein
VVSFQILAWFKLPNTSKYCNAPNIMVQWFPNIAALIIMQAPNLCNLKMTNIPISWSPVHC